MRFFDFLFPPRVDEKILRTLSADAFLTAVAPRLIAQTRPETVTILSFASPPVRAAIHEAKYHGSAHAFELLGLALAEYLRDHDERLRSCIIVPVPLSAARRKERGFNQVEEVARFALSHLGKAWGGTLDSSLLVRHRDSASQVSLPRRAREENMRGAFSATRPADPLPTYILLDDVITTGATLQAAIEALLGAGALHIVPMALAH